MLEGIDGGVCLDELDFLRSIQLQKCLDETSFSTNLEDDGGRFLHQQILYS